MYFVEGLKRLGTVPPPILEPVRALAASIDFSEPRFRRTEPALKYDNHLVSVPAPWVDSSAFKQDLQGIDLAPVGGLLDHLRGLPEFQAMVAFSCEISWLQGGASLLEHTDVRFYHLVGRRIQIPLFAGNASFVSRGRPFRLVEGEICEIDNVTLHYAVNAAQTAKLSLLIDFLHADILQHERSQGRALRRRVLWYTKPPEVDRYR